jgi:hypothetical protein
MTTTMQRDSVWGTSVSEEDDGRDRRLLRFVARHGCVFIEQVGRELGVGRTAAYRRVATCIEAGLLERVDLLREEPSLLRATRQGLRYVGLGGLGVAEVTPGAVTHWLRCTTVGQLLEAHYGPERVRTERELRFAERLTERALGSAVMGRTRGRARLHRPDFVILPDQPAPSSEDPGVHKVIAIEVELTPKTPRRLAAIVCAWQQAKWIEQVHYLCEPGQTLRAVKRAVKRAEARKVLVGEVPR